MRGRLLHRIATAEYTKSLERTVASPASRLATDSLGETRMLERESCNEHTPRLLMQVPEHTNNNNELNVSLPHRCVQTRKQS